MSNRDQSLHPVRKPARITVSILLAFELLWLLLTGVGGFSQTKPAAAATDPVIAAAGDIACDPTDTHYNGGLGSSGACQQKYTSDLLVNGGFASVLSLGDNQYYCGGYQAFLDVYDPTWGRMKSIVRPVAGNHEYLTSGGTDCSSSNAGAAGYFKYFGSAAGTAGQGWYSYDVGTWHIIALNSNCGDVGGCGSGTPQYNWLKNDLQTHNNACTLAFWHIPLFSSGGRAAANSQAFWNLLYTYNADVILNGHDHIYERFAPQTPTGTLDTARGIRQFTVGTGGQNHTSITTIAANSEVRNATTFGVLKLTLHPTSYDWQFAPQAGFTFTDAGTTDCHGLPATATPTPTGTGGSSITFTPQADAYVNSSSPTTNYGLSTSLRADGSPDVHSYARFAVSGLAGMQITRARLLFYMNSGSSSYFQAKAVSDNTWGETTINYNNAPPLGAAIANSGTLTVNTWVSMDVTPYITGEGTYSFGIITPGATAVSFASRESGGNAPELIVDVSGSGGPTPTNTPTATPAAATNTPTSTPTATLGGPANTPTNTPTATAGVPTNTPTSTSTATAGSGQTVTLVPAADTYVNSSYPTTNYGTLTALRADGSPDVHSYVRFSVSGLNGAPITRAQLRFYMNSASSSGMQALAVADNTWGETTVTYNTAPALGATIATSGALTTGTWVTLDVSSYVTGEGTYSFGITTPGATAISFASRESGANAPQLILSLGP